MLESLQNRMSAFQSRLIRRKGKGGEGIIFFLVRKKEWNRPHHRKGEKAKTRF